MSGTWLVGLFRPGLLAVLALVLIIGSWLAGDAVGPEMKTTLNGVAVLWAWTAFLMRRRQRRTDDPK